MVMVPKKPHQGNDRGKRKPPHRILHLGSRFTALLALAFWAVTVPNAWAGAQGNHATVGSQIATPMDHLQEPSPSGPPITLTLQDALKRAEKYSPQFQAAVTAAKLAREDQVQARAAMLPSISYTTQYLNTQGNGISPVGRFVTNDGVHVYRAWAVVHESMPATFFFSAGPRSAAYAHALAQANEEIARRGLAVTVTNAYYALALAQRQYATAEQSVENARRFLQISQELEQGGEVAHADVIRFQLQFNQQQQALENAEVAMSTARLNLAVLLFPDLNQNFTIVDDLDVPPVLPTFNEVQIMARNNNPQIRAALMAYQQARLNVPIWDWGTSLSKLHQAEDQRNLARVNLSFAQRQLLSQLYSSYNEAQAAWKQLDTLHNSVSLAARNL